MRILILFFCATLLNIVSAAKANAMAGELKKPSLAMPANTPVEFRTNLIAAISEKDCKFLEGSFINASTTLRYGGSTESLNHLLDRLAQFDRIRVTVSFARETAGPAWTLKHNGWADPGEIFITVNAASPSIQLEQLQIVITGRSTNAQATK
jgi:hypothetical protein